MALTCPTCKRPITDFANNLWRPFCTERCKLIDLGAWASEKHVISEEHHDDDDAQLPSDNDEHGEP